MFVLGINLGIRITDLLQLKVSQVSFNGKPLALVEVRESKTGKIRLVTLNDACHKALAVLQEALLMPTYSPPASDLDLLPGNMLGKS